MDFIKSGMLSLIVLASTPSTIEYVAPDDNITPVIEVVTTTDIPSLIEIYAVKHGVSKDVMEWVVSCESNNIVDVQSKHRYKKDNPKWGVKAGDQELSFGLAQIHLPSWNGITHEQAIDPHFALNFLAEKLSEGKGNLWTCYKMKY
jgi:hypothetical protein